jgi:outer membrane receptor for ferrienterochelin and colicins
MGRIVLAALLCFLGAQPLRAQLQTSVVSGRVVSPDGTPPPEAEVSLRDPLGRPIAAAPADGDGRFRLPGVAPGLYQLQATAPALRSASQRLAVRDGLPVEVELRLAPQLSEIVAVAGTAEGPGGASGTTLAGDAVHRAAAGSRSGALRAAIAETPGWTSEDNGLVHYRGADDGLLFVLDGVPVYERLDVQFGVGGDVLALGSVRVLSGYVPPEHGLRAGGVVEVRSRTGALDGGSGLVEMGAGGFGDQALSGLWQGPLGREAGAMVSLGGERSRRFLDPVSLQNLHNHGASAGGEAEVSWAPAPTVLTLRLGHAASAFDVPHTEEQEAAGQDQRQRLEHTFATLNWQRSWSARAVSQVALFGRLTRARLRGSAADRPLFAEGDREQGRFGLLAALACERGRHRLKAGLEASRVGLEEELRFHVTDRQAGEEAGLSEEALEHDVDDPFAFAGSARRPIVSFYLQHGWRPHEKLSVDAGVRFDRSRLLLTESAASPRVGISYRLGAATLRASMNRFFQPPQSEHLLLSSSPQARALSPFAGEAGGGGADVLAERQTAVEAGAELRLGALRADLAVWRRWLKNQADPNVFFGTTLIFPNSVARGQAKGLDVGLELPRRAGVAGFVSYTLAKVDQFGPINGGLFLEEDVIEIGPGTPFTPDHDQRHAFSAEASYEDEGRGLWVAAALRYRSGTPLEVAEEELDELAQRPGADLVDFQAERVKPYVLVDLRAGGRLIQRGKASLSLRASWLNLTGARYAFNFGNPFSGTHFGAPRSLRLDLSLALR